MKTRKTIRFILAAIIATLACLGLFANVWGFGVLFGVSALLVTKSLSSEFTKPIPRNELWWLVVFFIGFIALSIGLNYLKLPEPHSLARLVFAVAMWIFWMLAICYYWQKEKKNAGI